jgi:DNA-binding PadR family transcriptional regulator
MTEQSDKPKFQPESLRAKTLSFLSDGKAQTPEEIVKAIKGNLGSRSAMVFLGPILKDLEKSGIKVSKKDGQIQIHAASKRTTKKK